MLIRISPSLKRSTEIFPKGTPTASAIFSAKGLFEFKAKILSFGSEYCPDITASNYYTYYFTYYNSTSKYSLKSSKFSFFLTLLNLFFQHSGNLQQLKTVQNNLFCKLDDYQKFPSN